MGIEEFRASVESGMPLDGMSGPLLALWHEARGEWNAAHELVQDDPSAEAAWVHAYLHRREGDQGNASYWYAKAGRKKPGCAPSEELEQIAAELMRGAGLTD